MYGNQSPARTNIEEANKHLQLLHAKVNGLEERVKEKDLALQQKDAEMKSKLIELRDEKDKEISLLLQRLDSSKSEIEELQATIDERDASILHLNKHKDIMEEVMKYKPILANLMCAMSKYDGTGIQYLNTNTPVKLTTEIPSQDSGIIDARDCFKTGNAHDDDMADATESVGNSSPTIRQMAKTFKRTTNRHFSISEDELDEERDVYIDDVFGKMRREKELYL